VFTNVPPGDKPISIIRTLSVARIDDDAGREALLTAAKAIHRQLSQ